LSETSKPFRRRLATASGHTRCCRGPRISRRHVWQTHSPLSIRVSARGELPQPSQIPFGLCLPMILPVVLLGPNRAEVRRKAGRRRIARPGSLGRGVATSPALPRFPLSSCGQCHKSTIPPEKSVRRQGWRVGFTL
jgi:hypothetical protein